MQKSLCLDDTQELKKPKRDLFNIQKYTEYVNMFICSSQILTLNLRTFDQQLGSHALPFPRLSCASNASVERTPHLEVTFPRGTGTHIEGLFE